MEQKYDVAIIGGGILGTALSNWISQVYEGKVVVLEMENNVARHTSGRNTGVIHRPFYLSPERRKVFARCAQVSYGLWKKYAAHKNLPWKEIGTIEVATKPEELEIVHKYMKWAVQNGMKEEEVAFLTPEQVSKLEPEVVCMGAIHSKTDTSVDYRLFTEALKKDAAAQGVEFAFDFQVAQVSQSNSSTTLRSKDGRTFEAAFVINCAGGNAIDIAHQMGLGQEYTDLHFRGEYWEIEPKAASWIGTNIYSVPRHPELPFLDPHWIVRADGRREIGPNAVLVSGCKTYKGFCSNPGELIGKIFEAPIANKLSLFVNRDFLKLASEEWVSSISKKHMVGRVQKFIPKLNVSHLLKGGTAGIRSSVIDAKGNFLKEAIELSDARSFHILNYNSPGATGSPSYTALLVQKLSDKGYFSHLKKRSTPSAGFWSFSEVLSLLN